MTAPPAAVALIPVRVESRRLPRKALLAESGRPLFLHTFDAAVRAATFDGGVFVATDSDEVEAAARAGGAAVVRTSPAARTGSERCAEAAAELPGAVLVDIQSDWPEVDPEDLDALVAAIRAGAQCATLAAPLRDPERARDPEVVKVVRGLGGNALYFSRAVVPFPRVPNAAADAPLRHVGVYAFRKDALLRVPAMASSGLAETESLEQLRWLENGVPIAVLLARNEPWGIETRADYDAFLERLAHRDPLRP